MNKRTTPNTAEATRATVDPEALRLASRLRGVDPYAIEILADYGPGYWNPLLNGGDAKLFEGVSDCMALLHNLLASEKDLEEIRPGLALMVQTVWAATQYEQHRLEAVVDSEKEKSHD